MRRVGFARRETQEASIEDSSDSTIPAETLTELLGHFDEPSVSFENVRASRHALGCDVLADASWHESDQDGPGYTVRQTIVFLHRPHTTLPEFDVQPRAGLGNRLLGMLVSALGMPSVELDDEPELMDRYTIFTANPESVRVLLGREAIDSLLSVDDLHLKCRGRGALVSRGGLGATSGFRTSFGSGTTRDLRLEPSEAARLLEDASIAASPIVDDPDVGRRAADAVEGSYASEAMQALQARGGFLGRHLARNTITTEMLGAVRTAAIPRKDIPAPVARRAWGGTTMPVLAVPVFAFCFGVIGIAGVTGGSPEGWVFVGIGTLAGVIAAFIIRHRWIRKRIIRRGTATAGRVTDVERTNTAINNDTQHDVTIETDDGMVPVVVRMGSGPARQARRMKSAATATWVLRDPRRPSRGLWLEGWCLDSAID